MFRLLVCVLTLAAAVPAYAQRAEAQDAFERGRKQMKDGDFKAACASFETSLRLEATAGTLYNLGLCHEQQGKLASAWSELKQVADDSSNKPRAADAAKHVAALEPRLTRFKVTVPQQVDGLVIERDGIDITPLLGQEVPVDPRSYTFTAKAPGKTPVTIDVSLDREGQTVDVALPAFGTTVKPPPPEVPTGYPAQVALRPIAMPDGNYELIGANSVSTSSSQFQQTPVDGLIGARLGIQKFELGLRATFHERYSQSSDTRPNPWASVAGTLAYSITPMFAGQFEYIRFQPIGDLGGGSDLRVKLERKLLIAPRVGFDGSAGFVFEQFGNGGESRNELILETNYALQATATPKLSLEAAAFLGINLGGTLFDHTVTLGAGPRALYAASNQVDVFAQIFVGLLPAVANQSSSDFRSYTIGLNWRH